MSKAKWENDWPVLGTDGKVPETLDLPDNSNGIFGIVASDEFERKENDPKLPLAWQWNHNPDNKNWAILQNPGRLRITTGRIDKNVLFAKNTLTQRTFGPKSSATTLVKVSKMRNGDVAGLIAFQNKFGYVGVKKENDKMFIVMTQSRLGFEDEDQKQGIKMINKLSDSFKEIERIPLHQENVYFKIDCDFEADEAYFYYSLDGENWQKIGNTLNMVYTFTKHFMGYRFGLFNFATEEAGGYVDFDYYRVNKID